jgi:hypothetical protein
MHELVHQLACFRAKPKPARDILDRSINHRHFIAPIRRTFVFRA